MRVALLIPVLLFCITPAKAQDLPAGRLGHPLGAYLTIEGVRAEQGKVGNKTLLVDTVNTKKLGTPIAIWVENVDALPKDTRCVLRGYESGKMIGTPEAVFEAARESGKTVAVPQAGWQFYRYFVVISVVQPKDLTKNGETLPAARGSELEPVASLDASVFIRIVNRSDLPMQNVLVKFIGQTENYGNITPNGATEYRQVKKAYGYAYVSAVVDGKEVLLQPVDYVGETLLGPGRYTYALTVNADATSKYERLRLALEKEQTSTNR